MHELDELLPVHPSLIHPFTGEPLRAVGIVAGRPVWPILGAAEDGDSGDGGDGGDAGDGDDQDDDAGNGDGSDGDSSEGDGGKPKPEDDPNSIEYWKKRSRLNEREAKKAKKERDAALKGKPKSDDGEDGKKDAPDPEQLRQEAEEKVRAEILHDRVADKIEAKARKFADPEDAVAILLRQNDIEDFIDDGKVDVDAINEALADLAKKKPHLLGAQGGKRFEGGGDGGARKESGKSIDEQIEEAQKNRDFRTVIALKQRRAAEAKAKH